METGFVSAKSTLVIILAVIFVAGLILQSINKGLLVPYYLFLLVLLMFYRGDIAQAMSALGLGRDVNLIIAFVAVSAASLNIHVFEVVSGLVHAVVSSAYKAGSLLGVSVGRLTR